MTRKSKREIARIINDMEEVPPDEYPALDNLAVLLGSAWEVVDEEKKLWRKEETGEVWRVDPDFERAVEERLLEYDE